MEAASIIREIILARAFAAKHHGRIKSLRLTERQFDRLDDELKVLGMGLCEGALVVGVQIWKTPATRTHCQAI